MTQRRAARFVKNVPCRRERPLRPTSGTTMVHELGWESLQTRRLHHRLTMLYTVTNNPVELPPEYHPTPRNHSTRGHSKQFQRF